MAQIITPIYHIIDKTSLFISSYTLMQMINFYSGVDSYVEAPIMKTIAIVLPILWYIYKFSIKITYRKINKKNADLESENIELDNEIKKELLKRVKKGNIDELLEELEERQKELKDNETN